MKKINVVIEVPDNWETSLAMQPHVEAQIKADRWWWQWHVDEPMTEENQIVAGNIGELLQCKTHPDAPHGFVRNASHSEGTYICECQSWEEPSSVSEMCGSCGSKNVHEEWKTVPLSVGVNGDWTYPVVELSTTIPVICCKDCTECFTDWRTEAIRDKVVNAFYLGRTGISK